MPTLLRYDLLPRLIASVAASTLLPDEFVIVDNGGKFKAATVPALLTSRTVILTPGRNLGVSASWNLALRRGHEHTILVGDDFWFGPDVINTVETTAQRSVNELFVASSDKGFASGFCFFLLKKSLHDRIGLFDETFWPGTYEDSDYVRRMSVVGACIEPVSDLDVHHDYAQTTSHPSMHSPSCHKRYIEKWGGLPNCETRNVPADEGLIR